MLFIHVALQQLHSAKQVVLVIALYYYEGMLSVHVLVTPLVHIFHAYFRILPRSVTCRM